MTFAPPFPSKRFCQWLWLTFGGLLVGSGSLTAAVFPLETVAIRSSAPAGISYDPKAEVEQVLVLKNRSGQELDLSAGRWRVCRTRALVGTPDSIWDSAFTNQEEVSQGALLPTSSAASRLSAGASIEIALHFTPGKYGHFSIMVRLTSGVTEEEYRASAVAVIYPPSRGPKPNSPLITTASNKIRAGDFSELPLLARYGMRWVRYGLAPDVSAAGQFDWSKVDRTTAAFRENGLLMLTDISQWEGRSPTIGGKPVAYFGSRKANVLPGPEDFALYAEQVRLLAKNYHDVVPAGYLRNEPWEGGSITFYHGTGKYYRDWLEVTAHAVREAGTGFSLLAGDAITNFEDNLQMEGAERWVDITSHHNDLPYNRAAVQSAALGKRAWETEDWMSHYDAYLVANLTMKLAHGFEKSNPGDAGLYVANPGETGRRTWNYWSEGPPLPAPAGQAVSTWLHFIEDTKFVREIDPAVLPWMFLFQGEGEFANKHAAVVIGRIKAYGYGFSKTAGDIAWPAVTAFGRLQVTDSDHALSVFDFSGNRIDAESDGTVSIPLNEDAHYVVSAKGAADVEKKLTAARANYEGAGFAASLLDFTQPLSAQPSVRVTVKNVIQATVDASVRLMPPAGWRLVTQGQTLSAMKPGETRELLFQVAEAKENAANAYPFTLQVSSAAGVCTVAENLHVALFCKGTITVDGDLSDWEKIGAVPVTLSGGTAAADAVEKYWFPFLNLTTTDSSATRVRFAGAWDDNYFYVCAEVADPTEQYRPSMTHGVYYATHGAGLDYLYWGAPAFLGTVGDGLKIAFDLKRLGEKNDPWLPNTEQSKVDARFEGLSPDYEYDLYLGAQNKIEPSYATVRARHLDRLKNPPNDAYTKKWPPFEDPTFASTGTPLPEVWRLMAPGVPRHNYYPFTPRRPRDQGLVTAAKLVVKRDGSTWRYEAAIPWSELAEVKPAVGREVRFSFSVLNDGKRAATWAQGRSASAGRTQVLHPTWLRSDAIETVWSFQGPAQ